MELHCDNQSVVHLTKNQVFHQMTKLIDVRYQKLREIINDDLIRWVKIHANDNATNIFTKPVSHC